MRAPDDSDSPRLRVVLEALANIAPSAKPRGVIATISPKSWARAKQRAMATKPQQKPKQVEEPVWLPIFTSRAVKDQ